MKTWAAMSSLPASSASQVGLARDNHAMEVLAQQERTLHSAESSFDIVFRAVSRVACVATRTSCGK